jgi:hypothetical protein
MIDEERCEKIKEEYESLRRRLENVEFATIKRDADTAADSQGLDFNDLAVSRDDVRRFKRVKHQLTEECGEELPLDTDSQVDIPDYVYDDVT